MDEMTRWLRKWGTVVCLDGFLPMLWELYNITGDRDAALILMYIAGALSLAFPEVEWIPRSDMELADELCTTVHRIRRARKLLEDDLGIIETVVKPNAYNGAPTRHYRIIPDKLYELLEDADALYRFEMEE